MCYLHSLVLNVSTFIEMSEADPNDIDDIQDKLLLTQDKFELKTNRFWVSWKSPDLQHKNYGIKFKQS